MFKLIGCYMGVISPIDEFDTLEEAQEMLSEYRMAFGKDWRIWIQ